MRSVIPTLGSAVLNLLALEELVSAQRSAPRESVAVKRSLGGPIRVGFVVSAVVRIETVWEGSANRLAVAISVSQAVI